MRNNNNSLKPRLQTTERLLGSLQVFQRRTIVDGEERDVIDERSDERIVKRKRRGLILILLLFLSAVPYC